MLIAVINFNTIRLLEVHQQNTSVVIRNDKGRLTISTKKVSVSFFFILFVIVFFLFSKALLKVKYNATKKHLFIIGSIEFGKWFYVIIFHTCFGLKNIHTSGFGT